MPSLSPRRIRVRCRSAARRISERRLTRSLRASTRKPDKEIPRSTARCLASRRTSLGIERVMFCFSTCLRVTRDCVNCNRLKTNKKSPDLFRSWGFQFKSGSVLHLHSQQYGTIGAGGLNGRVAFLDNKQQETRPLRCPLARTQRNVTNRSLVTDFPNYWRIPELAFLPAAKMRRRFRSRRGRCRIRDTPARYPSA